MSYFELQNSKIKSSFYGSSAYEEYPPEKLWRKPWTDDITAIVKSLLSNISNIKNLNKLSFYNKKLLCLDIETTDYLPKVLFS